MTGEAVSLAELGGAQVHAKTSGVATFVYDDEETCLDQVRFLVSLLPSNSHDLPPAGQAGDPADRRCPRLADIVPADPRKPYDMRKVIAEITDHGDFMELHEHWARSIVCALARIGGRPVGLVASQPASISGSYDAPQFTVNGLNEFPDILCEQNAAAGRVKSQLPAPRHHPDGADGVSA